MAVLVDDAHWLDGSSAQALLFAFRRLVADPIAVLIAVREGDPSLLDGADLPTLRLAGLTSGEAATLLRGLTPAAAERLHGATAGNPLALIELAADGARPRARSRGRPGAGVRAHLACVPAARRRARRAPRGARWCWRRPATAAICRCSSGPRARLGIDLAALAVAESARPGHAASGRRSSSAIRSLGRRSTPRAPIEERRAAHRALAAALPDRDVDRRAWHLAAAAVGTDDAASAALEQAGVRSRDRSSYATAAAAFERAGAARRRRRAARPAAAGSGRGRVARRACRTRRRAARGGPRVPRPTRPPASRSTSSPATSRSAEAR